MIAIPDLFKQSWAIYKEGFWFFAKLIGLNLLAFLVLSPFGLLVALAWMTNNMYLAGFAMILFLAVLLAVIIACLCLHVAMMLSIRDRNFTGTVKEYFAKSKPLIWPFAWTSILTGLVVMLGFMLFIIPGIIFAVWFGFAKFATLFDGKKGTDALGYSKSLVKGNFWPVLGRVALIVGIAMILSSIPSVGFLINMFFTTPFAVIFVYVMYEDLKRQR